MIEKLRKINSDIIIQTNDEQKKKKHLLIAKLLKDQQCFLKMNIETSYALLRELNIPEEEIKEKYQELIDSSNYV